MRLVSMRTASGADSIGVLLESASVLDLTAAHAGERAFRDMLSLIEAGPSALDAARHLAERHPPNAVLPLSSVRLLAPIPQPPRMRAISLDPKHLVQAKAGLAKLRAREEGGASALADVPLPQAQPGYFKAPVYWFMDHFCVVGPDARVTWPAYSNWVDYELEIAAVIGTAGRDIAEEAAGAHIFGYTLLNDLSARDAQLQATASGLSITAKGKDFEGGYPMGPCIVTRDELDYGDIRATLRVNGEEWGRGNLKERYWTFEDGIAYASQASELIPGEILSSATVPNCCGLEAARKGQRGDCVELEVEQIGVLRTWID